MRLLSNEELETMSTYKHSADKTSLECWLIKGPLGYVERMFPSILSANTLTLMGQLPVILLLFYIFATEGMNITPDNLINPRLLIACGICVEWFSQMDIMDGLRARRMKVGSPLGRFVDEAGDTIVMSNYSVMLAYLFCFDNIWLDFAIFFMNLTFYGEEIRFKITKSLVMVVGEISSVEVELMLSSFFVIFGYYGNECLQKSIGDTFGLEADSNFALIAPYRVSYAIGMVFVAL